MFKHRFSNSLRTASHAQIHNPDDSKKENSEEDGVSEEIVDKLRIKTIFPCATEWTSCSQGSPVSQ